MNQDTVVQVGIDTPVRTLFDYRVPPNLAYAQPGMRVCVPFGRRKVMGIVIRTNVASSVRPKDLKNIAEVLDSEPLFDAQIMDLIEWAAGYYQYPVGAAFFTALPPYLRKLSPRTPRCT